MYVQALNGAALSYGSLRETDSMSKNLLDAESIIANHPGIEKLTISETNYVYGIYYYLKNEPEKALLFHQKALKVRELLQDSVSMAASYSGIGRVFRFRYYNADSALFWYKQSLLIREIILPENHMDIARTYYSLASSYRIQGNYEQAINHGLEALRIGRLNPDKSIFLSNSLQLVGNIFFTHNEFEKAIKLYNESIENIQKIKGPYDYSLTTYYNNIGTAYNELGEHKKAQLFFNKGLENNKMNGFNNPSARSDTYFNMGLAYLFQNKYDSSLYFYKKCLSIRLDYYGKKHDVTSSIYWAIGDLYESIDNLDSALYYYQYSLIAGIDGFDRYDLDNNPNVEQVGISQNVLYSLGSKAELLQKIYLLDTTNLPVLTKSYKVFQIADSALSIYRSIFYEEISSLVLSGDFKSLYQSVIETDYLLYLHTNDSKYAFHALEIMEKTKSMFLLESIQRATNYNNAGVPDSIIDLEYDLMEIIGSVKQKMANERHQRVPDSHLIDSLQTNLFIAGRELADLKEFTDQNYPLYINPEVKLDVQAISNQITKENESQLIEYFWGDSSIYAIGVTSKRITFIKRGKQKVTELINAFKEEINTPVLLINATERFSNFSYNAHHLYSLLVQPLVEENASSQLLIIPDGDIAYIPFEPLLTQPIPLNQEADYRNLPYLLNKIQIGYAYSLHLYTHESGLNADANGIKILAFSYTGEQETTGKSRLGKYEELPGTYEEIKNISDVMKGTFLTGKDATETNFKKQAPGYPILHLALHGESSLDTRGAKIIFRSDDDPENDGILYPHELYNLGLNAQLVVLSACETGIGISYIGEGVYSMARGFSYAGCPTVVMSLWDISDKTTSTLMTRMYENLVKGITLSESLKTSKSAYLQNSSYLEAHPYNWAGFITLGKPMKLESNQGFIIPILLALLIVSAFVYSLDKSIQKNK